MRILYRIVHQTEYRYASAVQLSRQVLRSTPRHTRFQRRIRHAIRVEPQPSEWFERKDFFGNALVQFALQSPHQSLLVEITSHVLVRSRHSHPARLLGAPWEQVRDGLQQGTGTPFLDPAQYLYASPHVPTTPRFAAYARPSFTPGRPLLEAVHHLSHRIYQDFRYDPTATNISTPVETVLRKKRGVCQDFAHLLIACLRAVGLAARYVSGYLLTHPAPGKEHLLGADATHAWVSVYCPEAGWVDLDPTNDLWVDQEHITVAWGRDFSDVSPLRGVILGGEEHELEVRVAVQPEPATAVGAGTHPGEGTMTG